MRMFAELILCQVTKQQVMETSSEAFRPTPPIKHTDSEPSCLRNGPARGSGDRRGPLPRLQLAEQTPAAHQRRLGTDFQGRVRNTSHPTQPSPGSASPEALGTGDKTSAPGHVHHPKPQMTLREPVSTKPTRARGALNSAVSARPQPGPPPGLRDTRPGAGFAAGGLARA